MTWSPLEAIPRQWTNSAGSPLSGYWLIAFQAGTTTRTNMAINTSGGGSAAKFQTNSLGYLVSSGNAVIRPHVDRPVKLALVPTEAEADASDVSNAVWPTVDNVVGFGFGQSTVVDTLSDLKALNTSVYTSAVTLGYYTKGDGGHGEYYYDSGSAATADDFLVIQPNSGGGRWKLLINSDTVNARLAGVIGDGSDETTRFNTLISGANTESLLINLPDPVSSYYKVTSTLTTITTCLGISGVSQGSTLIQYYATTNCIVSKGSYKVFKNLRLSNQSASGSGTPGHALLNLKNSAYSRLENVYTDHDLDDYSGILLEHEYTGSNDDAYFIVHLGCWYNTFINCIAIYKTFGAEKGYGVHYKVNSNAIGVVNPPGQPAGTYNGSVSNNTFIGPNIEGKLNGLRLDGASGNIFIGGQFLGCGIQVRIINGRQNRFITPKHNQWTTSPYQIDGTSGRNLIDTPTLFNVTATPWSLGTLTSTDVVRHSGEGMNNDQYFPVRVVSESIKASTSGASTPYVEWQGDNHSAGRRLLKAGYASSALTFSTYNESTGALVEDLISIGNGDAGADYLNPATTNNTDLGQASRRWKSVHTETHFVGAAKITSGTGTPEGVVTGNVGDLFLRTDGGAGTCFYVKESGSGNTGWAAK